jgi:ribonuclease HI
MKLHKEILPNKVYKEFSISPPLIVSFKVGIGQETNNFYELMALKLILQLAQEHGVQQIKIFGDSL